MCSVSFFSFGKRRKVYTYKVERCMSRIFFLINIILQKRFTFVNILAHVISKMLGGKERLVVSNTHFKIMPLLKSIPNYQCIEKELYFLKICFYIGKKMTSNVSYKCSGTVKNSLIKDVQLTGFQRTTHIYSVGFSSCLVQTMLFLESSYIT